MVGYTLEQSPPQKARELLERRGLLFAAAVMASVVAPLALPVVSRSYQKVSER
jgi:hypothetical protein